MALGRKLSGRLRMKRGGGGGGSVVIEEEKLGFTTTRYPKRLGEKRIVISNDLKTLPHLDSSAGEKSPLKKLCARRGTNVVGSEISVLESLPEDILIKVICGINHDDLKQLFHVSKTIREATSIAKEWHFAFNTPLKTRVFTKAPNAPLRTNSLRSLSSKKLSALTVALFSSPDQDPWPKRGLYFDTTEI